jgi:signal transduction histidine kinase
VKEGFDMHKDENADRKRVRLERRFPAGTTELEPLARGRPGCAVADVPFPAFEMDSRGVIADCNVIAERLVGLGRGDLLGIPLQRVLVGASPPPTLGRICFVAAASGARVHADNREISADIILGRRDAGTVIAIVFPTGEHGRLVGDDVAQIAHDLRNPVASIALEACLLEERLAENDLSTAAATIERITKNVEFLDRLIQDMLDVCLLERGRLVLQRRPTEMRTLLERTVERVVANRDRGRVSIAASEPTLADVDDFRIERVVTNLLANALRYSPSSAAVVLRLDRREGWCVISITDTGPGMTASEAALVFDKYHRGTAPCGRDGYGLGLFVSKRIVEAHGGTIGVESVHGIGSRFFVELPLT